MAVDALRILENGFDDTVASVNSFIGGLSPAQVAVGAGTLGAVSGGVVGAVIGSAITKKRKRKTKKKKPTKRKTTRKRKKVRRKRLTPLMKRRKKIIARKGRQTPYTARGGKDRSTRRIRMTKHGQPYVILKSGKARFIKKSSARRSRKMKGGRY